MEQKLSNPAAGNAQIIKMGKDNINQLLIQYKNGICPIPDHLGLGLERICLKDSCPKFLETCCEECVVLHEHPDEIYFIKQIFKRIITNQNQSEVDQQSNSSVKEQLDKMVLEIN